MCTFEEYGGDRRFLEKLQQIAELHSVKQHDYGQGNDPFANIRASQEFGVEPWVGAVIRLNDKVTRLKSFIANGVLKNESIQDSLLDIAVYALISLILFEEKVRDQIVEHDAANVQAWGALEETIKYPNVPIEEQELIAHPHPEIQASGEAVRLVDGIPTHPWIREVILRLIVDSGFRLCGLHLLRGLREILHEEEPGEENRP